MVNPCGSYSHRTPRAVKNTAQRASSRDRNRTPAYRVGIGLIR
jgi:hypothetical protein